MEITGYKHAIGSHCSSTLIRNILKSKGLDISEEMCFGIGAGLGFIYRKAFNPPLYFVLGRSDDLEEKICYFLGGTALRYTTDNNKRALSEVIRMIDNNELALVNLDASYLEYIKKKFDLFENVRYGGHRALVVGYDEEKETVKLADYLWNEPQIVSFQELERARSSQSGQTPPDNLMYTFLFPEKFESLECAARSGIQLNVNAMINPWYDVLGLPGMKKFCERVLLWPQFLRPEMAKENAYMTYMMMERVGTGGGNFRRLYSRFLREAAEILKESELETVSKIYAELGKKWKELALLLNESSMNITKGLWDKSASNKLLLDEIYQKEERAIYMLKELICLNMM